MNMVYLSSLLECNKWTEQSLFSLSESASDIWSCYPGSPSGHAMGAAGVYYTLVTSILAVMTSKKKFGGKKSTNKTWWVPDLTSEVFRHSAASLFCLCCLPFSIQSLSLWTRYLLRGWSLTPENYWSWRGDYSELFWRPGSQEKLC